MADVTKFMHIMSLDQVADLPEEDRRELASLFPDLDEPWHFIHGKRVLQEVGVERLVEDDTAYPPQASAYREHSSSDPNRGRPRRQRRRRS